MRVLLYQWNKGLPEPSTDSSARDADIRHVGNRHSVCRHPSAKLGPTVGLHE